jgi:hypothetical protein
LIEPSVPGERPEWTVLKSKNTAQISLSSLIGLKSELPGEFADHEKEYRSKDENKVPPSKSEAIKAKEKRSSTVGCTSNFLHESGVTLNEVFETGFSGRTTSARGGTSKE